MTTINNILGTFAPITLEQMSSVKLMNRTDTKFVTNMAKLRLLLEYCGIDRPVCLYDHELGDNVYRPLYQVATSKLARTL